MKCYLHSTSQRKYKQLKKLRIILPQKTIRKRRKMGKQRYRDIFKPSKKENSSKIRRNLRKVIKGTTVGTEKEACIEISYDCVLVFKLLQKFMYKYLLVLMSKFTFEEIIKVGQRWS